MTHGVTLGSPAPGSRAAVSGCGPPTGTN